MPRTTKKRNTRKVKIQKWVKRSKQRGGFIFTFAAIAAAISAGLSAAAPIVGTAALGATAAYATEKVLKKIGGGRRRLRH